MSKLKYWSCGVLGEIIRYVILFQGNIPTQYFITPLFQTAITVYPC